MWRASVFSDEIWHYRVTGPFAICQNKLLCYFFYSLVNFFCNKKTNYSNCHACIYVFFHWCKIMAISTFLWWVIGFYIDICWLDINQLFFWGMPCWIKGLALIFSLQSSDFRFRLYYQTFYMYIIATEIIFVLNIRTWIASFWQSLDYYNNSTACIMHIWLL